MKEFALGGLGGGGFHDSLIRWREGEGERRVYYLGLSSAFCKLHPKNQMSISIYSISPNHISKTSTKTQRYFSHRDNSRRFWRKRGIGEGKNERLTAIDFLARLGCIGAFLEADEGEPLGSARVAILGEEDARHAPEALEDFSEIVLFREFGDLWWERRR